MRMIETKHGLISEHLLDKRVCVKADPQRKTPPCTEYWKDGECVARKVQTTHGELDETALVKSEGGSENGNEKTYWVEYRLNGELVHRSADTVLKTALVGAVVGKFA